MLKAKMALKNFFSESLLFLLSFAIISGCTPKAPVSPGSSNAPEPAPPPAQPQVNCRPKAVYGPPPCRSDEQCVERFGAGWYCNRNHSFGDNGCGQQMIWPMCEEKKK